MGLNPLVIPNGIPSNLFDNIDDKMANEVRQVLNADMLLCKVARWDPDKCWNSVVKTTARLKQMGLRTVLLARGGIEPHGYEVISKAQALGLTVKEAQIKSGNSEGYIEALREAMPADIIDIKFRTPLSFLKVLYRASDGVLANSGHEPFGIVGLEAMAAGGIAFTGCTGEDYAIPYVNSFVLETADPAEIVGYLMFLRDHPEEAKRIREEASKTAKNFTWEAAIKNLIRKLQYQARIQEIPFNDSKVSTLENKSLIFQQLTSRSSELKYVFPKKTPVFEVTR